MGVLTRFSLPAPAKINLFLRITGRRDDGYHELQTVFQFLERSDMLSFELVPDSAAIEVSCPGLNIPSEGNLVTRAARMLQQVSGSPYGVTIRVQKSIPDGGGLGGGSSDAATTLCGLNLLWNCGFSTEKLVAIGRTLGADVPVFVAGETAWGEGAGDALTPVELPVRRYLVLNPGCHVSTAEVFSHPDLTRDSSTSTIARFLQQGPPYSQYTHDCEPVVCNLYPEVYEALGWLSKWGTAKMTGTGSCVFLNVPTEESGREILSKVPTKWSAFVSLGTQKSVLAEALSQIRHQIS
jgi:4-diphosphocytidyl-2-C-methyl-D-erythritol kinase